MLKLVYDLKAGFDDCYLISKNNICDLTQMLEVEKYGEAEYLEDIEELEHRTVDLDALREDSEDSFYQRYQNDTAGLLKYLEDSGLLNCLHDDSMTYIAGCFFAHMLKWDEDVPVWEPSNWRLEYDPTQRSRFFYTDAMSAKEVCDLLKLTRQQLHYYVKVGQIKKEYNPENPKQFKYNRTDVYVLQKKLEKKYDRYSK
jgi:hypothetical protein